MEKSTIQELTDNLSFVLTSCLIMIGVLALVFFLDRFVQKKNQNMADGTKKTKKIATIGLLSALGGVLTMLEIPIPVFSFYQLDFSEVPVLIAGFLMGPLGAAIVGFIKAFLHVILHGTHSAFVGEFAMFITGCAFAVPASVIYNLGKTRKNAIRGLLAGILVLVVIGGLFNGFYLIPKFAELYTGADVDALVAAAQQQIPAIRNVWTIVAFATVPFNILKGVIISVIVFLIYKPLSRLYRKL